MKPAARQMRSVAIASIALLLSVHLAGAAVQDPIPTVVTPATVSPFAAPATSHSFPAYDANGRPLPAATWRVTAAGGNCCEDYVAAEPGGRLLTFGGTYLMYSDDVGQTWSAVKPATVLNNGEGAVVAGPDGEVAGIGWDAYSGDHLQSFHYDPKTKQWSVGEVVLKNPFFDRPWITIARGPFTIEGHTYPFVWLVRGGTGNKDPELLSVDGLHYGYLSSLFLDERSSSAGQASVPATGDALADYWSPHPWAGTVPLSGGGLLHITQPNDGDSASCPVSQLQEATSAWRCVGFSPPGIAQWQTATAVCCQVRQDSRGWLSDVVPNAKSTALLYYLSPNQGRHWSVPATLRPPRGGTLEADNIYNYVVNGRLGIAAISARFDDADGNGQDMVFVVDVSHPVPRLLSTLLLGRGDVKTGNNAGTEGDRFDYASVAILPNGAIAASFDDSTTRLAAETLETTAGQIARDTLLYRLGDNQPNLAILTSALPTGAPVRGERIEKPATKTRSSKPLPATGVGDRTPLGLILISLAIALRTTLGFRRRRSVT